MLQITPKPFAEGFLFLEAPKWRDGLLWTSDVFDHKVYALSASGERQLKVDIKNRPSGLGFLSDGSLIIASAKDSKLLRYDGVTLADYADLSAHTTGWLNDFAIDPEDRIYVGNFGYDFASGESPKPAALHCVTPDGAVAVAVDEIDFPNGSVVIDGGRTLVVAETWAGRLTAFNIGRDGDLKNRRVFADLGSRQPDGICCDSGGAIWAGIYNTGEFIRVVDGGAITHRVQLDGFAVSCTIGGPDRSTLFMTAFIGTDDDLSAAKRQSAIFTADLRDVSGLPNSI